MSAVIHLASVFVVAGAALACGVPASAAPLLLIDGGDRSVVVLDLGARDHSGDQRRANIYQGVVGDAAAPRQVTGERHEFDCPSRREHLVATLSPRPGQAPPRWLCGQRGGNCRGPGRR